MPQASPPHALVIGGTGMLRGVVVELARRGTVVSVFARTRRRLDAVASEAAQAGGAAEGHALDWHEPGALTAAVGDAVARRGNADLAVVWLHESAHDGPLDVARAAAGDAGEHSRLRFVHVLGSAAADPSRPDDGRRARFSTVPGLRYEEVVLGFVPGAGGSRWLSHVEIAAGIVGAIDRPSSRTIVGAVEPWSARP